MVQNSRNLRFEMTCMSHITMFPIREQADVSAGDHR
jgi:hypothetical protein